MNGGLEPYLYESLQDTIDTQESCSSDVENLERLSNLNWYIFLGSSVKNGTSEEHTHYGAYTIRFGKIDLCVLYRIQLLY